MKYGLRQKLASFMYGRYGADGLYWFLFASYLVLWVLQAIFMGVGLPWVAYGCSIVGTVLLVVAIFRFFSRNRAKRQLENALFLKITKAPRDFFILTRDRIRDRKTHVYKKCPHCKSNLRLPKKPGEHTVRCPRCSKRFDVKIK